MIHKRDCPQRQASLRRLFPLRAANKGCPLTNTPFASREEVERREHEWLGSLACFSDRCHDRPQADPPDPYRTCFVRDRDRVLHSGAFRRLKDKTQVFVLDKHGDYYRTRLTHTLEVSQMARFLCRALRLNESLGEVLALVHDIGHPPFGHSGERILNTVAGVPFDHNRHALRIVDLLESPYHDRQGLNLTHVTRMSSSISEVVSHVASPIAFVIPASMSMPAVGSDTAVICWSK